MAHSTCIECARPSFLAICKECQQYEHCAPGEPFWQRPAPQKTAGCTEQQETPVRYVRKIRSGRIGHPDHCHRIRYVPKPGKRERHTIREAKSGHISETTDEPLRREDQSARVGRSSCSISICGGSSSAGISSSSSSCCISSNGGGFSGISGRSSSSSNGSTSSHRTPAAAGAVHLANSGSSSSQRPPAAAAASAPMTAAAAPSQQQQPAPASGSSSSQRPPAPAQAPRRPCRTVTGPSAAASLDVALLEEVWQQPPSTGPCLTKCYSNLRT